MGVFCHIMRCFAKFAVIIAMLVTGLLGVLLGVCGVPNMPTLNGGSLSNAFPKLLGWLSKIPPQFMQALPFIITAVVLVVSSITKKKNNKPAAVGMNYYREDR